MTIASSSPPHDGSIHQQRPQQQQHSSPFIPPPSSCPLRDDSLLSSAFQIPWSPSMMNSNEPFLSTSSSDPKATNDQERPQKVVAPAESLSSNSSMLQQEFSRQPHVLLSQRETVQQQQQHHRNAPLQQTEMLNMVPLAANGSESSNRDRTIPERQQRQEYAIDVIGYQEQSWENPSSASTTARNSPANDTRFNYDQRNQQNSAKTPVLQSSQHNNNESSNHITPSTSMFTSFGNGEQPYSSQMVTSTSAAAAPWATTTLWSGNGTTDTPYSSSPQTTHHSHQYLSPSSEHQQTNPMNSINEDSFSLDFLAPPPNDSLQQKKHPHSSLVNGYSSGSSTTTATSTDRRNVSSGMNTSSFEIFDSTFLNNNNNNNRRNEDNNSNSSTGNKYVSGPFSEDLMPVRAIPMSNVKAGVRTARMLIDATVAMKTRPQIQSYLLAADPVAMGERTVVILTGKVAQKSYGTEKRFLCPPPTVILDGASWWTKKHDDPSTTAPPQLMVSMSGETSETQEGQIDWFSVSGTTVGQTGYGSNNSNTNNSGRIRASFDKGSSSDRDWYRIQPRDPLAGGKCVLRQLYINDADDKRKRVECLARLQLADGTPIGTLASKPVKVISKPSKKRLSVKNMDSCIHHGTTVSLFNRIRSQTVSTKYLGVSASAGATSTTQPFMYPGQSKANHNLDGPASTSSPDGTCFIARTGSWDPFIVWLVDTTWVPQHHERESNSPDEYIGSGASTLRNDIPYPPPPAIAAKNKTGQPLAVHYNQHIVLQCLTTGLVSPVMIIRKIDRASTVVGGANSKHYSHYRSAEPSPSGTSGGEYGDEILGDPVSQLHKVALQIVQDPSSRLQENDNPLQNDMLPRVNRPVTYLACLNDMVGMHRSAHERKPIRPDPANVDSDPASSRAATRRRIASTGNVSDYYYGVNPSSQPPQQPSRSMYSTINFQGATEEYHQQHPQQQMVGKRSRSVSAIDQTNDDMPAMTTSWSELGAYWSEDVSDSAVWTIVGTDCAKYTFWELPPVADEEEEFVDERFLDMSLKINTPRTVTIAPVPTLLRFSRTKGDNDGLFLSMHGESFTRDLEVWFGDVRSPRSEYRGREHMVCEVPIASELAHSVGAEWKNGGSCSVPLLLVRRNGSAVYKTNKYYTFC